MWYFYSPTIIFGEEALDHLDKIEEDLIEKKVFIVTDPGIIKFNLVNILTDKLKELGLEYKIFGEVESDPREDTILRAAKLCQDYKPDLIIGLGGGSAMDAAKGVWILYERPELSIDDMHPFKKLGLGKKAKLIAIPTTAGTGAETTWAIIITRIRDGINMKLEQTSKEAIPNIAILDPRFCKTLPPKLTAMTAFDALGHAIEAIISTWKNDYSDAMSLGAVDLIRNYLPRAYKDGNDMEAREKLQNAAAMGGLSFGNSQVILGHTLAHVLGAAFHIPHGLGVGIYLPYILQYSLNGPETGDETTQILGRFAKMLGIANWEESDAVSSKKLVDDIKRLQKTVDFPHSLKELGFTKEKLDENMGIMTQQCYESASGSMSPRSATKEEYKKLILYAFDGKDIDF